MGNYAVSDKLGLTLRYSEEEITGAAHTKVVSLQSHQAMSSRITCLVCLNTVLTIRIQVPLLSQKN